MTSASVNMGNANMGVFQFFACYRHYCTGILQIYDCFHEGLPPMHGANLSREIFWRKSEKHAEYSWLVTPHNICHHLSKFHWNYRARMHKHEKKYEKHTASKTEVGSVARRQLAWKPELEKSKLNLPWQERLSVPLLQTGLPHGFSLHPLGRGFLSAQHLPPILPKVCLTWSCLNTSRQYCLLNQPLLTWAPGCTSCKLLLKRLCLATKILSKPLSKLFLLCHRSVTSLFATFSSDDSKQFCEELPRCLLWDEKVRSSWIWLLADSICSYSSARTCTVKLETTWQCWLLMLLLLCYHLSGAKGPSRQRSVTSNPQGHSWWHSSILHLNKTNFSPQTHPFLSPRFKHISAHKDTCALCAINSLARRGFVAF